VALPFLIQIPLLVTVKKKIDHLGVAKEGYEPMLLVFAFLNNSTQFVPQLSIKAL
jgi:hypothetical protein